MHSQTDGNKYIEMVLQRELDREERDYIKLVLVANDGGSPQKSGTVKIHVTVLDVNDNAPVCKQSVFKTEVSENSSAGTIIGTISAADADEGVNGHVSYSFAVASKEARELFGINTDTGEIRLLNNLDYESQNRYQLK